jgi:hypothetical protein
MRTEKIPKKMKISRLRYRGGKTVLSDSKWAEKSEFLIEISKNLLKVVKIYPV